MTRLPFPRFLLRSGERGRSPIRPLMLESLDQRIVLSGVPDVATLAEPVAEPPVAVTESAPLTQTADAAAPVYLETDGTLHVHPPSEDSNIVVRQYVNYQLQEVVEVEMAGQWTAFPVEQVQEIQIHSLATSQPVDITDGVTVPVQLVEPEAVDAVFAAVVDEPLVTAPVDTTLGAMESGPEGEGPGGIGEQTSPPAISNFDAVFVDDHWEVTGVVTDDESVVGLEVVFGGILAGSKAVVQADGSFFLGVILPPGASGIVTAVVTDLDGLDSLPAITWIE